MADALQVACVRLGGLDCAVDVLSIAEIVNPLPVTPVPGGPALVEGLVELRGRFLPVIDLRRRLGLPVGPAGKLLIGRLGAARVALVCDDVSAIERLARDEIRPAPELGATPLAPGYLTGVARHKDGVLYVIDLGKLFSDEELAAIG